MRCGFVGTLGTLSTWVKQEHGFKKVSQKWLYGFAMVGFSVLISFSILNKYWDNAIKYFFKGNDKNHYLYLYSDSKIL